MKYYLNSNDKMVYAFDSEELANKWLEQLPEGKGAFRIMTDEEISRHLQPEKYMTKSEKLLRKRKDAICLARYQFLTMAELSFDKNKDALISVIEKNFNGKSLIKLRNYLLESQSFSLTSEELWNLLTNILQIDPDKLFNSWEEAQEF